ncbi:MULTISPECIES: Rid family detoxifying hydrolase [Azospirillum]|uniref:Rid family detoxifying hydrolase n=3 Tax=Azospirillum TaxID=191 RepID=A0ABU4P2V6_AZOBR|nr:Rid family detoxifying hydrolase [Azospirillum brasilense]MDW7557338.1 Rid family detoxifying hydrolase [Azospirillum brasilense]MDW7597007.1 Rid family detoxifying hydrolase [Azospirillum brasilense]MDW7632176.1 Rid family detoxifying hydrolase [Azospirillum brasilense]MDX5950699.1 Rid family detoxifying hydrolase [Azospirillum brasilense]TVZ62232.1 reactive intermediate/imine deaminase [Azospirillum brasilense]
MMTDTIATDKAPAAIGPYAQARVAGGLLFVSGQLPIDPATGTFAGPDAPTQAARSLTNIAAIAEAAGTSLAKAVKMTVYVTDLTQFKAVNEVYAGFFQAPFPARSTVEVSALPLGASVEIDAVIAL